MLTSTCVAPASRLRTSWVAASLWNAASLAPSGGALSSRRVLVPARAVVRALRRRARASAAYPKPKQKSRIGTPPPQQAMARQGRLQSSCGERPVARYLHRSPSHPPLARFDDLRPHPRHQRHALAGLERFLRIGGGAVETALFHALHDGRETEEGEGEAIGPRRDAWDGHPLAIFGHIFLLRWNAKRLAVDAGETAHRLVVGEAPLHALVGEVGERVADGGELPIDDGKQARPVGLEDHVIDAVVAVHEARSPVVGWLVLLEPLDQDLHVLDVLGLRGAILLGPAVALAREIAARPP